jgi:hypothetical protein
MSTVHALSGVLETTNATVLGCSPAISRSSSDSEMSSAAAMAGRRDALMPVAPVSQPHTVPFLTLSTSARPCWVKPALFRAAANPGRGVICGPS